MQSAPTPAPAPDPVKTAQAQSESNRETAVTQYGLNATNQRTPTGSLKYEQIGTWADGTPRFEATTQLTPEQQQLLNINTKNQLGLAHTGNQAIDRVAGVLATPVDFGPNLDLGPKLDLGPRLDLGDPLKLDTDAAEARTMELARKRLDPMLAQRAEAKKAELFNAGVQPGTEAYRRGMEEVSQSSNDAINQLILGGHDQAVRDITAEYGADQARRQGEYASDQDIRRTEYGADQTRRQLEFDKNLSKTKMTRDQMFNEIASLLSGTQIQLPQFQTTPQPGVAPTDVIGAQQQALNQSNVGFNAANQRNIAMMSGLFGLGKTALGAGLSGGMGGWGMGA